MALCCVNEIEYSVKNDVSLCRLEKWVKIGCFLCVCVVHFVQTTFLT